MTDAELVELAIKAYGEAPLEFSPLTDDGDALRLAVKCGMLVEVDGCTARAVVDIGGNDIEVYQTLSDPMAATRRAIVRAAAEVGKAML